jgi:hypothetical protein
MRLPHMITTRAWDHTGESALCRAYIVVDSSDKTLGSIPMLLVAHADRPHPPGLLHPIVPRIAPLIDENMTAHATVRWPRSAIIARRPISQLIGDNRGRCRPQPFLRSSSKRNNRQSAVICGAYASAGEFASRLSPIAPSVPFQRAIRASMLLHAARIARLAYPGSFVPGLEATPAP